MGPDCNRGRVQQIMSERDCMVWQCIIALDADEILLPGQGTCHASSSNKQGTARRPCNLYDRHWVKQGECCMSSWAQWVLLHVEN